MHTYIYMYENYSLIVVFLLPYSFSLTPVNVSLSQESLPYSLDFLFYFVIH